MTGNIHLLDPCSSDEWMAFISAHPHADIFHHPAWMRVLRATYGFRFFAVCLNDGTGIRAGMPFADVRSCLTGNRWVSLPFSDHCRPLLPADDPSAAEALMGYLHRSRGVATPTIAIHWGVETGPQGFRRDDFVSHTLRLDRDEASILKSNHHRRAVLYAQRNSVTVRECTTWTEYETFYRLQVRTRRRHGVPVQPKALYRGLWDLVVTAGLGFVLVAYKDGIPLAGALFMSFNSSLCYKYGASDARYRSLQGGSAVMWTAIQKAIAAGIRSFDFGRSERTDEGLCRFKRHWGATERPLPYTIMTKTAARFGASKLSPVVARLIQRSPEFVCTLTGQLYRHFA
jgi:CelD/BcsL family acetyltransferase involved in cellulose biosynthesis